MNKKVHRLEVEWEDSTNFLRGWDSIDTIIADAKNAVIVTSAGLVIDDNKRVLVLAVSVHGSEATGVMVIPKSAIRKRRRLR